MGRATWSGITATLLIPGKSSKSCLGRCASGSSGHSTLDSTQAAIHRQMHLRCTRQHASGFNYRRTGPRLSPCLVLSKVNPSSHRIRVFRENIVWHMRQGKSDMDMRSTTANENCVCDKVGDVEVSVVMPCLNEAGTVGSCVEQVIQTFQRLGTHGEVIVADNGSSDGSPEVARMAGARVVHAERRGYGSALQRGISVA